MHSRRLYNLNVKEEHIETIGICRQKSAYCLEDGTSITGKVVDWFDGYDLDGSDEIVIGDHSYLRTLLRNQRIIVLSTF